VEEFKSAPTLIDRHKLDVLETIPKNVILVLVNNKKIDYILEDNVRVNLDPVAKTTLTKLTSTGFSTPLYE